jgi:hypothetical protein
MIRDTIHGHPHEPDHQGAGVTRLSSSKQAENARTLAWVSEPSFHGWTCSHCDWNYPLPTLLNDPEAKTAYDRLATGKFRQHACSDHAPRLTPVDSRSFTVRIRKLVLQGFKPRDAVELFLQEVSLEFRDQPKTLEQARADGEDFLRRVRAGLI